MTNDQEANRHKSKKLIVIIAISLALMLVITVVVIILEQPSVGTITTSSSTGSRQSVNQTARNTHRMSAEYFGLAYDETLDTLSNVTAQNPGALEAYRVSGDQRTLSVAVKQGGGVTEESAYRLRKSQNDLYRESTKVFGAHSFVVMKKTDGSEIVAITQGQGRYVVIAYTLQDPLGNIDRETDAILESFRWL